MITLRHSNKILRLEELRRRAYLTQKQLVCICGFSAVSNYSRLLSIAKELSSSAVREDTMDRVEVGILVLSEGLKQKKLPLKLLPNISEEETVSVLKAAFNSAFLLKEAFNAQCD